MSRSVEHRPIDADLASLGYLAVANHTDIPWIHALLDISSLSPPPGASIIRDDVLDLEMLSVG